MTGNVSQRLCMRRACTRRLTSSIRVIADKTVPQTNLGNRVLDWPRGRVLGGSSAVNGLYL